MGTMQVPNAIRSVCAAAAAKTGNGSPPALPIVAHAAAGDGGVSYLGPVLSIPVLVGSWYLRPQSRRLAETLGFRKS